MDSRGGPYHVCGVAFFLVWYLVLHILDQLPVYPTNMSALSILVMKVHLEGGEYV